MRKIGLYLLAITTMTLFFSSCSSKSDDSKGKEKNVKITVMAWNDAADALTAVVPGFEAKHPGVKVEIIKASETETKLTASFTAGAGAPDIAAFKQSNIKGFFSKFEKSFVPLDEYITKDANLKSEFPKWLWDVSTSNGKTLAFPWDIGPSALYYRTDIFAEAGVDINSIKTYDDYIEAGKKIKEKTGGKTTLLSTNFGGLDWRAEQFLRQQGGQFFSENGEIAINSPEMENVLKLHKKFMESGVAVDDRGDWGQGITLFSNSKIATVMLPVWYAGTIMHSAPDQSGKWAIAKLPAFTDGGSRASNQGGSLLTITKQSKNPDVAYEFIKYALASEEGNTVMLKYGLFPSWTPFYSNEAFNSKWEYFGGEQIYKVFGEVAEEVKPLNFSDIFADLWKPLGDETAKYFSGKQDEKATMDNTANTLSQKSKVKIANK